MQQYSLKEFFPPLSKSSLVRHYIPAVGSISYGVFGCHFLSPKILSGIVPRHDFAVANSLFFNAHLGVGLFIYYRHHMRKVTQVDRVIYSVYGTVLFNFGSVLVFATTQKFLPENPWLRSIFALVTSVVLLGTGREYFKFVDSLVSYD